jgi:membrane associated rhomboid family serine protease
LPIQLEQQQFMIENTETERFSFQLISYFMEHEDYTVFNFKEKILENFNHAYYQILFIYSKPLHNDVNIEALFEKISIMKQQLRKTFFSFNPSILVLCTNSELKLDKIETPKNVTFVNLEGAEELKEKVDLLEVYPKLGVVSVKQPIELITLNINRLSLGYAKKINEIFSKKRFGGTLFILMVLTFSYLLGSFFPETYKALEPYILFNKADFKPYQVYQLITNSFIYEPLFSLFINGIILFNFGLMIERLFGTTRYLFIVALSFILSNSLMHAFTPYEVASVGFSPLIYGLIGAFIYAFLVFRRLLAYTLRRMMVFFGFAFIFLFVFFDLAFLTSMIGAGLGGIIGAFIVGIPNARNSSFKNRALTFIFTVLVMTLGVLISIK